MSKYNIKTRAPYYFATIQSINSFIAQNMDVLLHTETLLNCRKQFYNARFIFIENSHGKIGWYMQIDNNLGSWDCASNIV